VTSQLPNKMVPELSVDESASVQRHFNASNRPVASLVEGAEGGMGST
jgi:hypothetical protein